MSNKRFGSFLIILILTGIGIIAGANMVVHGPSGVNQNKRNSVNGTNISNSSPDYIVTPQEIVNKGSYITTTSSTSAGVNSSSDPVVEKNPITATTYLVGDIKSGEIYISSHSYTALPVASMSKLMTAIVATDIFTPTTTIEITPISTNVASDTSYLLAGEKYTLDELLRPLLLSSSNVAAEAIASTFVSSSTASTTRTSFMDMMSNTSWEVGMPDAYFADPSGLDPQNRASARDIFAMARYLYDYRTDILDITKTAHVDIATTSEHGSHVVDSTHPFVTDPRFLGGKTGRTPEAGETMLTILNINDRPIAFIVLHSRYGHRATDTSLLIKKYTELHH